jgi:signal transduction histidine kinase
MPEHFPEVLVNFQQIQQCFLNILSNARYALNQKYPETSDNKSIQIAGEETIIDNCPHVKIVFLDHGTGIPAKILDKVMNPFFTTKPRGKGTGLGLSISHGIITEHGGKLVIDSVEGEYTRVVITLPTMQKLAKRPA